jgi:hypothetical protein
VIAQDFAAHGTYTEPNTGITFYTSYETNGTVVGDGEFSTVSWGGYTSGIALPENALIVDSYDYLGLIVSFSVKAPIPRLNRDRLALSQMVQDGLAWCMSLTTGAAMYNTISCF